METEDRKLLEVHRKDKIELITTLLGVLCFICLLAGAECINSAAYKKYVFYLFDTIVILILVVIPMIHLIDEGKGGNRHIRNITMFIDIILAVMLCILSYFILKVQYFANKPYYSAINKMAIVTITFIFIKIIMEYTKKAIQHYDRSKSKFAYAFGAVILFLAFINLASMPFINLYKSKTIIYTKDIKIPYNFEVMKIDKEKAAGSYKDDIIGTISDRELIKKIYSEISNREYENIRNLDELNDQFFNYNENPYYKLLSDYEGFDENRTLAKNSSNGYFYWIIVYSNGQVEINDYNDVENGFGKYYFQRYRVYLSDSTKDELLKAVKALDNY